MALAAAVLAAAAMLVAALWPRAPQTAAPSGAPAAPAVSAPPPVLRAATPPPAAPDDLPEAVQRYLEATVYPPTSGLLTAGHENLLHPNRRHESPRPLRETLGADPSEVVRTLLTADRYYVEAGEPLRATLEAWRGRTPIPEELVVESARFVREGRSGAEGEPAGVAFVRREQRLEAELPLARFHDHHGPVRLDVRFRVGPDGEPVEDTLRFFHTPASRVPAVFTGELRDEVAAGSLRIEVGLDVRDPGFYRIDANLFGAGGTPVAFVSFKGELARGLRFAPLEVYGKVLRDAGTPGPWELRDLRGYRFVDGRFPDREQIPATPVRYTTGAWSLEAFTEQAWTSASKQRMIELLLEDAARGISLDVPPLPGQGGPRTAPEAPDEDFEPAPPPPPPAPRGGRGA